MADKDKNGIDDTIDAILSILAPVITGFILGTIGNYLKKLLSDILGKIPFFKEKQIGSGGAV